MHHIGAALGIFIPLYDHGFLMHVVCFRIMTHVANIFNNPFYVLMNFDRKDSSLYTVVSVGMVVAGFVTRVAPIVWLWKIILKALFLPCSSAAWPIKIFLVVDSIICDV